MPTLDASILIRGIVPSQFEPRARQLLDSLAGNIVNPEISRQEFYNAALKLLSRGLMTTSAAEDCLSSLDSLGIHFADDPSWLPRSFARATRFGQPNVFDGVYLCCAEDAGTELWTADARFVRSFGRERPERLRLYPEDLNRI